MDFENFDPSKFDLVNYITSSNWYHPTTPEQWIETGGILLFATICFIFLRWVYAKFPAETAIEPTSAEVATPSFWGKTKTIWCRYWRCFINPLLILAYITGICLAIRYAPLYTTEFNVVIRSIFSITSSLCVIAVLNNILIRTDTNTRVYKFIKVLRWKFVFVLLLTLIYPVTNNPVFKTLEYALLVKIVICLLICFIALRVITRIDRELNHPVLHKLKWPIFTVLFMAIMLPLVNELLPRWAHIIKYWVVTSSICYIIYIALIKNLNKLCPNTDSYLYHIIKAFSWPLFWTVASYGYSHFVAISYKLTHIYSSIEAIRQTIPLAGFWYAINSLFSSTKTQGESEAVESFSELICNSLAEKYPNTKLLKNHKQALIALISFISNLIFIFACYYILQIHLGIKTPIFYAGFFLLAGLKFDNIYGLLEVIAQSTKSFFFLLFIQCFKKACKFAILLCFVYYFIESMPFTFPEGDKAGEVLHRISILLCFTFGIWKFTAPKNISYIFEYILNNPDRNQENIENQETAATAAKKIYPILISHVVRAVAATGVLLALFKQCGYDIDTFAAFVSAILVAIGFIVQEPITNYFSSIILMKDRPLSKGDWVIINDIEGEVMDITYRCTAIKKFTQEYVYIPNNTVMTLPIINLSKMKCRPYEMNFNLNYNIESETLEKIISDIRQYLIDIDNRVNEYEPRVYFNEFGDFAAQINVMAFIKLSEESDWLSKYEQWLKTKHEINLKIINIVKANGVEIAVAKS